MSLFLTLSWQRRSGPALLSTGALYATLFFGLHVKSADDETLPEVVAGGLACVASLHVVVSVYGVLMWLRISGYDGFRLMAWSRAMYTSWPFHKITFILNLCMLVTCALVWNVLTQYHALVAMSALSLARVTTSGLCLVLLRRLPRHAASAVIMDEFEAVLPSVRILYGLVLILRSWWVLAHGGSGASDEQMRCFWLVLVAVLVSARDVYNSASRLKDPNHLGRVSTGGTLGALAWALLVLRVATALDSLLLGFFAVCLVLSFIRSVALAVGHTGLGVHACCACFAVACLHLIGDNDFGGVPNYMCAMTCVMLAASIVSANVTLTFEMVNSLELRVLANLGGNIALYHAFPVILPAVVLEADPYYSVTLVHVASFLGAASFWAALPVEVAVNNATGLWRFVYSWYRLIEAFVLVSVGVALNNAMITMLGGLGFGAHAGDAVLELSMIVMRGRSDQVPSLATFLLAFMWSALYAAVSTLFEHSLQPVLGAFLLQLLYLTAAGLLVCTVSLAKESKRTHLAGLLSALVLILATLMQAHLLVVFGAVALFAYFAHLARTTFHDSFLYPVVLTMLGVLLLVLGKKYQSLQSQQQLAFLSQYVSSHDIDPFNGRWVLKAWALVQARVQVPALTAPPLIATMSRDAWLLLLELVALAVWLHAYVGHPLTLIRRSGAPSWTVTSWDMRYPDGEHGLQIIVRGQKPPELDLGQVELHIDGGSLWLHARRMAGPVLIRMFRRMYLPMQLMPHGFELSDEFRPTSRRFEATITLGTGVQGPKVRKVIVRAMLRSLQRRANPQIDLQLNHIQGGRLFNRVSVPLLTFSFTPAQALAKLPDPR